MTRDVTINTSTPGRICLFGEHQDYLGLPVIAMAINKRIVITGKKRMDQKVIIHMPDLNQEESFDLDNLEYKHKRDYFKSGIRVLKDIGIPFPYGVDATINGDIPIQSGTSSSSAMVVGWIHLLLKLTEAKVYVPQKEIAALAHRAEVLEFNEPGGMMDHYSTAMGGLIYLESEPEISVKSLACELGTFVLGDSCEKKNTLEILKRCKQDRMEIMEKVKQYYPGFLLNECQTGSIEQYSSLLGPKEFSLLEGTLKNRDLLQLALKELASPAPDLSHLGNLLTRHHEVLRDALDVSTPKIERMMEAALDAGALGGKINGTGGGGCMFALAPVRPDKIATAIEKAGGKAYIIEMDGGTSHE